LNKINVNELTNEELELVQQLVEVSAELFKTSWFILIGLLILSIIQFCFNYTTEIKNEIAAEIQSEITFPKIYEDVGEIQFKNKIKLNDIDIKEFLRQDQEQFDNIMKDEVKKLSNLKNLFETIQQQESNIQQSEQQLKSSDKQYSQIEQNKIIQQKQNLANYLAEAETLLGSELDAIMKYTQQVELLEQKILNTPTETERTRLAIEKIQAQERLALIFSSLNTIITVGSLSYHAYQHVANSGGFAVFLSNKFDTLVKWGVTGVETVGAVASAIGGVSVGGTTIGSAIGSAGSAVGGAFGGIGSTIGAAGSAVGGAFGGAFGAAGSAVGGAYNWLSSGLSSDPNLNIDTINNNIKATNSKIVEAVNRINKQTTPETLQPNTNTDVNTNEQGWLSPIRNFLSRIFSSTDTATNASDNYISSKPVFGQSPNLFLQQKTKN
jgi:hypothetical protein